MKKLFTLFVAICAPIMLCGQMVITQWPFDVDGDLSSGNGIGQAATLIGGTTEVSQDDALRVSTFPDQYLTSGTAGIELMASTEGFENILLEYKGRTSGTMSRWAEIHYTLDGGTNWLVLTNNQGGLFPRDDWHDFSFDLGQIAGANENPDFGIRIVSIFSPVAFEDGLGNSFVADTAYHRARDEGGGVYSGEGNWRFQDVTLKGIVPLNRIPVTQWAFDVDGDLSSDNGIGQPATLIGGTTEVSQDDALRVTNFPDQFEASGTAGIEIMASTAGFDNILLEYKGRTSATMSRWAEIHYTLDGGSNWLVLANNQGGLFPSDDWHDFSFDFGQITGANGNPDFGIQIVSIFSPVAFDDGLGNSFAADTAYHRARDAGGNPYAGTGNWRFQDVIISGVQQTGAEAAKLSIASINNNEPVYAGEEFSITVHVLDADDLPVVVAEDVTFTISLETGTGTLSGDQTGTIEAGSSSVTITGFTYDVVENGVVIKVEADDLEAGLSNAFDVLLRTYTLTLVSNFPGAGELTGAGNYAEGDEITIEAIANEGFDFVNWTLDGEEFAATSEFTFDMPAEELTLVANFEEIYTGGPMLVHYWHFNTLSGTVTEIPTDYSVGGLSANITYPGTGEGYMDARTHNASNPVSNFNLRLGQEPNQGAVLRVRNPANTRELLFEIPSTGYQSLVVTWAATRTENGGTHQRFEYSADAGTSWVTFGDDIEIPFIGEGEDIGQYANIVLDLSAIEEINDNPDLHFRILSVGEGNDNPSGNHRIDNFTLDGVPILGGEPAMLAISSINNGDDVYVNEEFSLMVQVFDAEGLPSMVTEDITVTLSVETGTGALGGNITGIIEEGSTFVEITGITYSVAEAAVVIKAEAVGLDAALSDAFDVLERSYTLTLTSNIPGAGVLTGAGTYTAGQSVTIEAVANEDYEFSEWILDGDEFSSNPVHTFTMPDRDLVITAYFLEVFTGDPVLVHYWHFNTMTGETVTVVNSDYSAGGLSANITYPGTGNGYMDARTHREADPVSNFNLRQGQEPDQGAVLRVRNPAATRELLFQIPSTGYQNLVVTYAATRSENGGQFQRFEYSPDGGSTWVTVGGDIEIPFIGELGVDEETGVYAHVILDLTEIQAVNDNPDLFFRILSVGEGNDNPSGNQRLDNFSVDGVPLGGVGIVETQNHQTEILLHPNPASDRVYITLNEPGVLIRIFNINGMLVMEQKAEQHTLSFDISHLKSGVYIVQGIMLSTGKTTSKRLIVR